MIANAIALIASAVALGFAFRCFFRAFQEDIVSKDLTALGVSAGFFFLFVSWQCASLGGI